MKYQRLSALLLRAPYYSYVGYDRTRLPALLKDEIFLMAIRLASEDFYRSLQLVQFDAGRLQERQWRTLHKYYNRMCYRGTPFGLFATVTLVDTDQVSPVRLSSDPAVVLHTAKALTYQEAPLPQSEDRLFRNPILYRHRRYWRYAATIWAAHGRAEFLVQEIAAARLTNKLLKQVGFTATSRGELTTWVSAETGSTVEEAGEYVRFLEEEQLLLRDEEQPLIVEGAVSAAGGKSFPVSGLETGQAELLRGGKVYTLATRSYHNGSPPRETLMGVEAALQALVHLAAPLKAPDLANFIRRFQQRFDRQKVPLLQALDPDLGVGYGEHLLFREQEQPLPGQLGEMVEQPDQHFRLFRQLLLDKWTSVRAGGAGQAIMLDQADLDRIPASSLPAVATAAVMFRCTTSGPQLQLLSGVTATALTGRFTLFDEDIGAMVTALARHEEALHPEIIFADITHRSEAHADNISRRRQVYRYELLTNTTPALESGKQIWPEDLLVSVVDGELMLESLRHGKRVIPRLATAYNYQRSASPLFRFLCDLQGAGLRVPQLLTLEGLFPGLAYYPRLIFQGSIWSPQTWRLTEQQLAELSTPDDAVAVSKLALLREQLGLPQWVTLGQGDQQLVVDLSETADAGLLLSELRGRKEALLKEYLFPDQSVKADGRPLAGEFIASFLHQSPSYRALKTTPGVSRAYRRAYFPGSEWLYLQLFCSPASAGAILGELLSRLVRQFAGQLSCWFFIRYREEGEQLRLRFRCDWETACRLLQAMRSKIKQLGLEALVHDYRLGTYRPELERYPPWLLRAIEDLFQAGSDLQLAYEEAVQQIVPDLSRLELGVVVAFDMLTNYLQDAGLQILLSGRVSQALFGEFQVSKADRLALDRQFRGKIADLFAPKQAAFLSSGAASRLLRLRQQAALLGTAAAKLPEERRLMLAADLVHMQLNRTFDRDQRRQEMMVWYFLHKQLRTQAARRQLNGVCPPPKSGD